jgi:hypothetical protein
MQRDTGYLKWIRVSGKVNFPRPLHLMTMIQMDQNQTCPRIFIFFVVFIIITYGKCRSPTKIKIDIKATSDTPSVNEVELENAAALFKESLGLSVSNKSATVKRNRRK